MHRVEIRNFRGAESAVLDNTGNLNVLIGKNNSGKSTFLDALALFFDFMSHGSPTAPIARSPSKGIQFGKESDFRNADGAGETNIEVELLLTAEDAERLAAIDENLVGVPAAALLKVGMSAPAPNSGFAYLTHISIKDPRADVPFEYSVLSMTAPVAAEIYRREQDLERTNRFVTEVREAAEDIRPDTFSALKRQTSGAADLIRSALRDRNPAVRGALTPLLTEFSSYDLFLAAVEGLIEARLTESHEVYQTPLSNPLVVLGERTTDDPDRVKPVLGLIGGLRVLHLRDRRRPIDKDDARRLLELKTRRNRRSGAGGRRGQDVLRTIQDTIRTMAGVNVDAFEGDQGDQAEIDADDVLVEMNGAGVREALRLVLDVELKDPDLILVEEPEVHLHPALEVSMFQYLKAVSTRAQIFVSTHSTNFLDSSASGNVYLTRRTPWVTATPLDYQQAQETLPGELGIRLSSLFMYDRLVFVEGASDEEVLRALAATAGFNLGQSNVGFVPMGSARNFTHFANAGTIELLTKRQVRVSFVLDRDENTDTEVDALKARLADRADVHVLARREIENYLAAPRALAAFIRAKQTGRDAAEVTVHAVATALVACADELHDLAVRKRVARTVCKPVFPDREAALAEAGDLDQFARRLVAELREQAAELHVRQAEIADLVAKETDRVDQVWERDKLAIVPGDELLDAVCKRFGVRYRKGRDAARLARELTAEEIPGELRALLRGLVS
ncbi:hypothetical protein L3i22_074240 [Actinoplanes sp. L3-i22]|nr:hypothetical protein L3i22_074240 [Actinoplanes sp. L3-i22]